MAPDTLAALLAFLAFIAPGLSFELLRERRRPSVEETAFREASRIALTSLLFSGGALVIVVVIRAIHRSWFVDPGTWLKSGAAYASVHLPAVGLTVMVFVGSALTLAVATDVAFRRRAAGQIVPGSIWFSLFRQHRPQGTNPWIHIRLADETEIWGYAGDYTPEQKLDNRELLVEGPQLQYRRKGATENTLLPNWSFIAVRGETISWMKVQYVAKGEDGNSVIVPAKYDEHRSRLGLPKPRQGRGMSRAGPRLPAALIAVVAVVMLSVALTVPMRGANPHPTNNRPGATKPPTRHSK